MMPERQILDSLNIQLLSCYRRGGQSAMQDFHDLGP
jgi:hypothetical protein